MSLDFDKEWQRQTEEIKDLERLFITYTSDEISDKISDKKTKFVDTTRTTQNLSNFWSIVYAIETNQGRNLYRPKNKLKTCTQTASPCGHHQLSLQALKDINCISSVCRENREDYSKSLEMTKKLQRLNEKRLKNSGLKNLPEYQRYLVHQQGANGLKNIILASRGRTHLSKSIKRNMANNSPYSLKSFTEMSSQQSATEFLQHWQQKWKDQKDMITLAQLDFNELPSFNQMDLNIALNLRY